MKDSWDFRKEEQLINAIEDLITIYEETINTELTIHTNSNNCVYINKNHDYVKYIINLKDSYLSINEEIDMRDFKVKERYRVIPLNNISQVELEVLKE